MLFKKSRTVRIVKFFTWFLRQSHFVAGVHLFFIGGMREKIEFYVRVISGKGKLIKVHNK